MQLVNCSEIAFNDQHNYYGGAIGNISYNLVSTLIEQTDFEMTTFATGTDFEKSTPKGLDIIDIDGYDDIESEFETVLHEVEPDIVTHLYFYEPSSNPVINSRLMDQPFVIGMCEMPHKRYADETSGIEKVNFVRTLGRLILLPRFKRTLQACDKLIVVNQGAKDYYSQYYPDDKIDVVPYGVDTNMFYPTPLPEERRILIVSRLIKRRNIGQAIDALAVLRSEFPDAKLDLVGEGPQENELRRQARLKGLEDAVTFKGNVGPNTLVDLYQSSYVYCHLSEEDGWNQTVLEAMACGRPVIVTDKPHNSMVHDKKTGILISYGDTDELVSALRDVFKNRHKAVEIGKEGKIVAEKKYNLTTVAEQYAESLRDIV